MLLGQYHAGKWRVGFVSHFTLGKELIVDQNLISAEG